jgi:hypothetical protein
MKTPRSFRVRLCLVGAGCLATAFLTLALTCRGPGPDSATPTGPEWFQDITDKSGLNFVHDAGAVGDYFMPQIMASGCALISDKDGQVYLYLLTNGGPKSPATNKLYRRLKDGRLEDVTAGSGLGIGGYNCGVAVGDVNNDGWPDVLVTQYGGIKLFLNNGNGTFTDVTAESGLENPAWGASAAFVDVDRDGWLDLVVVNYLEYSPAARCHNPNGSLDYCHPSQFRGQVTRLFRNVTGTTAAKGKRVAFKDITLSAGLGEVAGPGLGVICADFNGDGWPDIFVANDSRPNHLWINNGQGTHFREEAVQRGVDVNADAQAQANMGVALGYLGDPGAAGDHLFDLFVTHLTDEYNTLWRQGPRGQFQDQSAAAGLARPTWRGTGFGTVMADFNHDGALDIAMVNGRVNRGGSTAKAPGVESSGLASFWWPYAERNQVFANDGSGHFRDISPENRAFCGIPNVGRGLACGDIDGDGAPDLLVSTVAGRARLFRNIAPHRGHWLIVRALLDERHGHRDAYGAEITVVAGRWRWERLVNPGSSYLSSNDPRAHFGLGDAARVDEIRVLWPDGKKESFAGRAADQAIELRYGEGRK